MRFNKTYADSYYQELEALRTRLRGLDEMVYQGDISEEELKHQHELLDARIAEVADVRALDIILPMNALFMIEREASRQGMPPPGEEALSSCSQSAHHQ